MLKFNKEILELWERNKNNKELTERIPFLHTTPNLSNDYLLVIEINPAFNMNRIISFIKRNKLTYNLGKVKKAYNYKTFNINDIDIPINLEKDIVDMIHVFNKTKKISSELGLKFFHVDLFQIRETNQKKLEQLLDIDNYSSFFDEQYAIIQKFISEINPKIILVTNAFAGKTYKERENLIWDKGFGTYLHPKLKVPVFLSGMLYGQRAIDNHSYERLHWHLNLVYNKFYK